MNVNSGLYMDISGASTANGANAIQWAANSGLNQQFQLLPYGSGYYTIIARQSGECLEVDSSSTNEGTPVIQWPSTYASNQLWLLQPGLDTGAYVLTSKSSGLVADISGGSVAAGADVVQDTLSGAANQHWAIENAGNGYYKFKNENSGLYMDISGVSTVPGTNAIQWTSNTGYNQQFYLLSQGGGYYYIVARHDDQCLNVNGASTSPGATIIQEPQSGSDNESWLIQLVNTNNPSSKAGVASTMMPNSLDTETDSILKIYPNPVNDLLYIQLPGSDRVNVEMYDLDGALIGGKTIANGTGTMNMSGLSSGVYILRINDGQRQYIKKIIKM